VVCRLEARVFVTDLVRGMAGEDGGYIKYYGRLLKCERILGRGLVGECIEPGSWLAAVRYMCLDLYACALSVHVCGD